MRTGWLMNQCRSRRIGNELPDVGPPTTAAVGITPGISFSNGRPLRTLRIRFPKCRQTPRSGNPPLVSGRQSARKPPLGLWRWRSGRKSCAARTSSRISVAGSARRLGREPIPGLEDPGHECERYRQELERHDQAHADTHVGEAVEAPAESAPPRRSDSLRPNICWTWWTAGSPAASTPATG